LLLTFSGLELTLENADITMSKQSDVSCSSPLTKPMIGTVHPLEATYIGYAKFLAKIRDWKIRACAAGMS